MTADALDDTPVVRASRDGDRSAFGRLYTRYSRMVHAIEPVLAPAPEASRRSLVLLSAAMIVRSYDGKEPRFGERVFVAENAAIIGDVELGDDCSVWFSTTIRGDVNAIRIGARTNIQDNCTIHVTHHAWATTIGENVTIGHGAIVHGCTVHRGALIGMGSRVLDGAIVGESALVGAGALVPEGMQVPPRTLVVGVPARVKRPLTEDELAHLERSWQNYVQYKEKYLG